MEFKDGVGIVVWVLGFELELLGVVEILKLIIVLFLMLNSDDDVLVIGKFSLKMII